MLIEISNLRKAFGSTTALDGLDLTIQPGEFFGLLGPNGAGKSTFMNLFTGYHKADSGELRIDQKPYDPQNPSHKSCIGFVPQNIALYDELTAAENLRLFGELSGVPMKTLKAKVYDVLERIELADRAKERIKGFSGGMKRRLNIASSLMHDPEILLCDEPTVGIDPQSRNAIFELLQELNRSGTTIIYSTHYMEEAEKLCDQIGIIDHGKILANGTLDQLLEQAPTQNKIFYNRESLDGRISAKDIAHFGTITEGKDQNEIETNPAFSLSQFYAWIEENELPARWFRIQQPTLENLFLQLTGRDLRE